MAEATTEQAKSFVLDITNPKVIDQNVEALKEIIKQVTAFGVKYGFQILGALIIMIIGYLLSRWVQRAAFRMLEKKEIDITARTFSSSVVKLIVLFISMIIALGTLGVSISPMIAALGAATFGITLALQGPISNYGAGLMIILTHPFRVNDTIEIQGISGVVADIKLAVTILENGDGERITIPNSQVVGQVIVNSKTTKIAVATIGVAYTDDIEKAVSIIKDVLDGIEDVSTGETNQVGIYEFGDSSINIQARYWVPTRKYYSLLHEVNLKIFKALIAAGISIPFPQREVRLLNSEN